MVNNIIWIIILITGCAILSPPTILLLAVGLLPTGIAYILDKSDEKYQVLCIGSLNVCGVFPYLLEIWFENHSLNVALHTISNFLSLTLIFVSAGIGLALFRYVPPVISSLLKIIAKRRLLHLRSVQRNLVEQWGILGDEIKKEPSTKDKENKQIDSETHLTPTIE